MICRECGFNVADGQKFCSNCGAKTETEQVVSLQQQEKEPVQQKSVQENPTPNIEKTKKQSKTVFSVIVSIFIVLTLFTSLFLVTLRTALDEDNIEKIVTKIDLEELFDAGIIDARELSDGKLSEKEIVRIYEKSTFEDFVVDFAGEFSEFLLGDEAFPELNGDDVVRLVQKNEDVIMEYGEISLSERDYEEIERMIDKDEEIYEAMSIAETVGDIIRIVISPAMIIGVSVILVLLIVWLFIKRKWNVATLCWCGISWIVAATLFVLGLIAFLIIAASLLLPAPGYVGAMIAKQLLLCGIVYILISLLAGVLFTVAGRIISKKIN